MLLDIALFLLTAVGAAILAAALLLAQLYLVALWIERSKRA